MRAQEKNQEPKHGVIQFFVDYFFCLYSRALFFLCGEMVFGFAPMTLSRIVFAFELYNNQRYPEFPA